MINKIKPQSNRRGSLEYFTNQRDNTYYILIPDTVMQDRYTIFWRNNESFLNNTENANIPAKEFPWKYSIILTYDEIKTIHKSSRYVLTKDLPEDCVGDSLGTLKDLVIQRGTE